MRCFIRTGSNLFHVPYKSLKRNGDMKKEWKERLGVLLSQAVNLEHTGFYLYLSLGARFDSPRSSLLNLRDFFYKESNDETKHAKIVIKFINQMGLKLTLDGISAENSEFLSVVDAFQAAEKFEQSVLDHYVMISREADSNGDCTTSQFIDYFLDMQVREVKALHDLAMNARRASDPLGEFLFDQSFKNSK